MIRSHWAWAGPSGKRDVRIFRWRNVRGGHITWWSRLVRIGPVGIYLIRYAPGWVDETAKEHTP